MSVNPTKCVVLRISTKKKNVLSTQCQLNGHTLKVVDSSRYLGVTIRHDTYTGHSEQGKQNYGLPAQEHEELHQTSERSHLQEQGLSSCGECTHCMGSSYTDPSHSVRAGSEKSEMTTPQHPDVSPGCLMISTGSHLKSDADI